MARCAPLPVLDDLQSVVDLVRRHGTVYLRYSNGPEADAESPYSRDYEADLPLPGLSVTTLHPEDWWTRPVEEWVARRMCKYAELAEADRYAWVLTGDQVGVGPDHEPLVVVREPLARLSRAAVEQAARCYRERLHVGQDSRARLG